MLVISDNAMRAFHAEGRKALRQHILAGWYERLRGAGEAVGDSGRNAILGRIDEMSLDDPTLTIADLTMLADLMLVDAANELRAARS